MQPCFIIQFYKVRILEICFALCQLILEFVTYFRTQQQEAGMTGGNLPGGPSGFYGDLDDLSFGGNQSGSQTMSSTSCSTGNNMPYDAYP